MRGIFAEFRQFILRGNVVDLAVGIVIGAAFTGVVQGLVKDMIDPLIAAIFGQPNFGALRFTVHHSVFLYGDFITGVITLVLIAVTLFFLATRCPNCTSDLTPPVREEATA